MTPLLLGLLGLGAYSFSHGEVRRFEASAAADLASKVGGEHRHVEIRAKVGPEAIFGDVHQVTLRASTFTTEGLPMYAEPWRSKKGLIRSLNLDLSDFVLTGLPIRRLKAKILDSRFDFAHALRRRQVRLSRSGTGPAEVEIDEAGLATFLVRKFTEIDQCKVTIDRDKVSVDGTVKLIGRPATKFFAVGRLEIESGVKLKLAFARYLVNGEAPDEFTLAYLSRRLNPLVDLNVDLKLAGAVKAERLLLREGLLKAWGTLRIPEEPKPLASVL